MHEFVPQPRLVQWPYYNDEASEEDDYEVYLFYPSINRIVHRHPWDEDTVSDLPEMLSPTYSYDSEFVFPENPNNGGIMTKMGYSAIFRSGLWTQSCRISKYLDTFITKVKERLRSLKSRLARKMSRQRQN